MERLKSQLLAMVQSVLKFIQALCTSPSDYVFLEAKNTSRRPTCSCLAKCEFKLIFLNYEKWKTIPILQLVLSNLAHCGSWDCQGLMVQQRHTEKNKKGESLTLLVVPAPLDFSLGKSLVTFNGGGGWRNCDIMCLKCQMEDLCWGRVLAVLWRKGVFSHASFTQWAASWICGIIQ